MKIAMVYKEEPSMEEMDALNQGIATHAKKMKGQAPLDTFGFFLRDENDHILGGCNGYIYYGCFDIDQLWVDDVLRGQGYGVKLIHAAEKLAKEKGCLFAVVNTMDWEALGFYKKLGYYVEFERHGFLKDSTFYFLRKAL